MTSPFSEDQFYDRTLVHSMLLTITKPKAFRKTQIKPEVLAFVKGSFRTLNNLRYLHSNCMIFVTSIADLLTIRVSGNENRLDRLNAYIQEFYDDKKYQ